MSPQSNSTQGLSLPSPTLDASGPVQQPSNPAFVQAPAHDQVQGGINLATPTAEQPIATAPPTPPPAPAVAQPMPPQQAALSPALPTHLAPPTPIPATQVAPQVVQQPMQQVQEEELNLDDDALDEEWVNKAKSVAEQYQADPYMASKALSKVKAEYLQRRYGKQIKVSD